MHRDVDHPFYRASMDQEQASRRLAEAADTSASRIGRSQRLLTEGLARIERQRAIIDHLDQRLEETLSEWRRRRE